MTDIQWILFIIDVGFGIGFVMCLKAIYTHLTLKIQGRQRNETQAVECLRAMLVLINTDVLVRQDAAYTWQLANLAKTLSDAKHIIGIYDGALK